MIKIISAVALLGGIYGGVNEVNNCRKLGVKDTFCGISRCGSDIPEQDIIAVKLDITGENVNFLKRHPLIELPPLSGLRMEKLEVKNKDIASARISIKDANPGEWAVKIEGIKAATINIE